ncbi:hypothetical protein GCM10007868_15580 [Gluconobacter frateurii]|uniref:Transposase n=1 Tax=Gluconobacter frateurii NRIC 0228 TaxID=1307946 RepID=A0ABQ0QEK6_9PROT|nr:hypothetical protein AA0228_2687 [Gluconobacter frateurii NRIC 0228]GLP90483.1 hypothetical protein GCM10007868_15580 [Gluconobacter frateurii]
MDMTRGIQGRCHAGDEEEAGHQCPGQNNPYKPLLVHLRCYFRDCLKSGGENWTQKLTYASRTSSELAKKFLK